MGRPKKPMELQSGNISKHNIDTRELEEQAVTVSNDQLQKPPSWLRDNVAKKEWKRLIAIYNEIKIIGNLDYNNLGAYCNAFSNFIQVSEELKGQPYMVEHTNKIGVTNIAQNPLITIQRTYSDEMKKYSTMLGLSVDSRLKLAPIAAKEKNAGTLEFGDI